MGDDRYTDRVKLARWERYKEEHGTPLDHLGDWAKGWWGIPKDLSDDELKKMYPDIK